MPSLLGPDDAVVAHDEAGPRIRRLVLVSSGLLFVAGTIGSNLGPALVDEHPLPILLLSARNRNLLGSVPFIDPLPFALIGFLRLLAAGVALFFLGRLYGRRAITWAEGQIGELPAIYGWFQKAVDRAGWLLLILMPASNLVCLMAGYRRMRTALFLTCISVGIVLKLIVLWVGGRIFDDEIRWFLDAIDDYQWYVVGGLFLLTFLQSARKVRTGLPEVIEELEHPEHPDRSPHSG